jgi:hypothetical protein
MKVQPNFTYQKYEGKPEDQAQQFQKQLSQQHIVAANAINATIDDLSFWTRERQTSYTWVDLTPIYTQSFATVAWTAGGTVNIIPMNIQTPAPLTGFVVRDIVCCISNGTASTSDTLLLPHLDVSVAANSIEIVRNGQNIVITSGGTNRSAYSGFVTVYYTKN